MQQPEGLGGLVDVALDLGTDYNQLRLAIIRREVRGKKVGHRWYVDRVDAKRWKRQLAKADPAPAA